LGLLLKSVLAFHAAFQALYPETQFGPGKCVFKANFRIGDNTPGAQKLEL
jgi:hypothetical protein